METVVLDIEGTVCPISFVHDVLFPYALAQCRQEIPRLRFPLDGARSELESYLVQFPAEFVTSSTALLGHIEELVARDVKIGYLKALQGFLWRAGYESGAITAPIYADAVQALRKWAAHTRIYIYSSGSVPAQQLLFRHTDHGDLTPLLAGYFDTANGGPKMEPASYARIDGAINGAPYRFFSDNPKEIDAAHQAGWRTTFVVRPGNPEFPDYQWPDRRAETFE